MRVSRHLIAAIVPAFLAACSMHQAAPPPPATLGGTSWNLVRLVSNDDAIGTVQAEPAKYEMTLAKDGGATLRLDCNRAVGRWQSDGPNRIGFTPLAMTRAACPPGSLDTRVARELGFVRTYLLNGNELTLLTMADGGSQVWQRKAE